MLNLSGYSDMLNYSLCVNIFCVFNVVVGVLATPCIRAGRHLSECQTRFGGGIFPYFQESSFFFFCSFLQRSSGGTTPFFFHYTTMKRTCSFELDEVSMLTKKLKASYVDAALRERYCVCFCLFCFLFPFFFLQLFLIFLFSRAKKRAYNDEIDFSSLKRHRVLDSEQLSEFDPLLVRISEWLNEQNKRGSLPKTFTKLVRAVSSMCKMRVQVDPTVVFYHLLFNKVIVIEQVNGSVMYRANPEPVSGAFIGIVPEDSSTMPFSDDFIRALKRTTNWVLTNRGLHHFKDEDGLLKGMAQLCTFSRELSPYQVVELLKRKGYVCAGHQEDEVCYSLPILSLLPPPVHYAPIISSH